MGAAMKQPETVLEYLSQQGVSRRAFLKFCAVTASSLALPMGSAKFIAEALAATPRPVVIWLNFQACTGCVESTTRSFNPTIEDLILNKISLEYQSTLMVLPGPDAVANADAAMAAAYGRYILLVEGAVPLKPGYSLTEGQDALQRLAQVAPGAALIIAIGSCASFGGLPHANPNPSDARSVRELMQAGLVATRPLVNVSGCPPIPEVITGVIAYYLTYGRTPPLDSLLRPASYYGHTVHMHCTRLPYYMMGLFAKSYDDVNARKGYCLYKLGCRGPFTHNSCTTIKWNKGTSFPMLTGHNCIGCSEPNPNFWDKPGGFYVQTGEAEGESEGEHGGGGG